MSRDVYFLRWCRFTGWCTNREMAFFICLCCSLSLSGSLLLSVSVCLCLCPPCSPSFVPSFFLCPSFFLLAIFLFLFAPLSFLPSCFPLLYSPPFFCCSLSLSLSGSLSLSLSQALSLSVSSPNKMFRQIFFYFSILSRQASEIDQASTGGEQDNTRLHIHSPSTSLERALRCESAYCWKSWWGWTWAGAYRIPAPRRVAHCLNWPL